MLLIWLARFNISISIQGRADSFQNLKFCILRFFLQKAFWSLTERLLRQVDTLPDTPPEEKQGTVFYF
jgi:hypothetical protein